MSQQSSPAPRRSLFLLGGLALAAIAVLAGLGVWQLRRGAQKQVFIAALNLAASGPPKPAWSAASPFDRVSLAGSFEAGQSVFVRVTLPEGLGVYVLTPLRTAGATILVNRGFMKTGQDGRPPAVDAPAGPVTVIGLRRGPEPRGWFAPPDNAGLRLFATRNPPLIAAALGWQGPGWQDLAADYLEAEPVAGAPAPNGVDLNQVIARIPDNHLVYALTWFGLAVTLAVVFLLIVLRARAPRR